MLPQAFSTAQQRLLTRTSVLPYSTSDLQVQFFLRYLHLSSASLSGGLELLARSASATSFCILKRYTQDSSLGPRCQFATKKGSLDAVLELTPTSFSSFRS
ncbi:hypothetical protein T12_7452 [Trichinella patagoniensis]|uniref:Uncharacterized protein n=1 Tax=Trichinella patagoniensis TaxID=990121 RepID=A0A0V1AA92_9BILA|nr:hypothetical protein T12_7452 [Trichinella patagoniensis]